MKSYLVLMIVTLGCVIVKGQDVIRTNTELVQTAVTVLDKKGHFVEGLQREQFELMVDGKPRPVTFFERVAAGSPRELEIAALNNPDNTPATPITPARVRWSTTSHDCSERQQTKNSRSR